MEFKQFADGTFLATFQASEIAILVKIVQQSENARLASIKEKEGMAMAAIKEAGELLSDNK
jgi:hypothetical protein